MRKYPCAYRHKVLSLYRALEILSHIWSGGFLGFIFAQNFAVYAPFIGEFEVVILSRILILTRLQSSGDDRYKMIAYYCILKNIAFIFQNCLCPPPPLRGLEGQPRASRNRIVHLSILPSHLHHVHKKCNNYILGGHTVTKLGL